jgi:hypothetical protein
MARWHLIVCFTHAMDPRHVIGANRVAQNGSSHRDYLISIDDFPSSLTTHRSNSTRYPDTSLKLQELINQHLIRNLESHKSTVFPPALALVAVAYAFIPHDHPPSQSFGRLQRPSFHFLLLLLQESSCTSSHL